jgi:ABC-type Na+ efflux pump permease subunit
MQKSLQRLKALVRKEMVQILRDRRTLTLFFLLPLIELFLFGYAVSLTVTHLPTAIVDQSMDTRSRDFIQSLVSSGNFDPKLVLQNEQQVIQAIDSGTVKAGVVIPPDFAEKILQGKGNVMILLDGSDSFSVQSGYNAASSIAQKYSLELIAQKIQVKGSSPASGAASGQLPITTSTPRFRLCESVSWEPWSNCYPHLPARSRWSLRNLSPVCWWRFWIWLLF